MIDANAEDIQMDMYRIDIKTEKYEKRKERLHLKLASKIK